MTTDGTVPPPPAVPPASPTENTSGIGRLVGVLFSPDETFASIARRPDWVAPLVLFLVFGIVGAIVFAKKADFVSAARAQMEERHMTQDQIDRALKIQTSVFKVFTYASPVFTVVFFLVAAAILMLAYRVMGGEGNFLDYFSVFLYAWVPRFLQSCILTALIALRAEPTDVQLIPTLLRSNLAFLVDLKTQPVLFSLLSSLDIFTIWSIILMIIGFAHVSRMSKGKSAGIMVTLWGFVIVIKLGFAALGAVMARARK
jgi:hypothetical protein